MDVLELRGVNPAWPNGIISHVVGFTHHGAYVVDVWQSLQIFDAFLENRLKPAFEIVEQSLRCRLRPHHRSAPLANH